ncbi:dUTPase [Rossellomorea vietnamensis]|uniref:dUTPase n=1 Tax=Rossellomorea vietnamensis TaxID=218284 RepID=A0A5D4MBV2_9BACI|nr:dUTP diphosphatase [Rossellomorea vietnamensis]TYR99091.1 dUTPase [Rossellomorea vietnamensis]
MNLETMLERQQELDNRIIREKNLTWTSGEQFMNTLVALDVELSEFANNGRWFKVWSEDQAPRIKEPATAWGAPYLNPLLEEYADCVSFFLSLANQRGWQDHLYINGEAIEDVREEGFDGDLNGAYLEMKYYLFTIAAKSDGHKIFHETLGITKDEFYFKSAWFIFISIGIIQYGFEWEDIYEAYMKKNQINHERQDQGY